MDNVHSTIPLCTLLLCIVVASQKDCEIFQFSKVIQRQKVTFEEHTDISFKFHLNATECPTTDLVDFSVSNMPTHNPIKRTLYSVSKKQDLWTVEPSEDTFFCITNTSFEIKRKVTRSDSGEWSWWSTNDAVKAFVITVVVSYDAQVHSLEMRESVSLGDTFNITCNWRDGNTPSVARLVHNGTTIQTSPTQPLLYTLRNVSFQDAGEWKCESPKATENKTKMLKVQCGPKRLEILSAEQSVGTTTAVNFTLCSCSPNVTQCYLTEVTNGTDLTHNCSSFNYTQQGDPPHFQLSVILPHGNWTLTVTTDIESTLNFSSYVYVTTDQPITSSTPNQSTPTITTVSDVKQGDVTPSFPLTGVLLGINAAVLIAVLSMILIVVLSRKGIILRRQSFRRSLSFRLNSARTVYRRRRWRLFPRGNRQRVDVCMRKPSNHPLALPEPPVALSPNDYDLINDDHIVVRADDQGATARPQPCLPRSGYLHPIPAPEDVFGDFKGRGVEETKGATGICKEAAATPLNCTVRSAYLNPTPSDVDRHQTVQKLTEDAQTLDFTGQGARPKTNWRLTRNNRLHSASPNKAPQSLPVTIPKTPIRLPLRGNCLSFPSNYVRSETWADQTDQVEHKEEDGDTVEAVPLPPKRPPRKDLLNLNPQNKNRLTSLPLCPEIEVIGPDGGIQQSPPRPPPRLPSRKGRHQTTKQRQEKEVQKEDVGCQDVPSPCTFKTSEQSSLSAQELLEVLKRRQKHDTNLA